MATIDHLSHLRADAGRLAAAIQRGPLGAPVQACPGWDLTRLTLHLGHVHRWARLAAATAVQPNPSAVPGPPEDVHDPDVLALWLLDGADALLVTLGSQAADAPTWHPFPVPLLASVWPRRQAQETLMHRWDAEAAVGEPGPVDAHLAADGIDEYFTMMLPRLLQRDGVTLPAGAVHVECTDTPDTWTVSSVGGELFVTGGTHEATGSAATSRGRGSVSGSAADVLLTLWGRAVPQERLQLGGDTDLARRWLSVGGV